MWIAARHTHRWPAKGNPRRGRRLSKTCHYPLLVGVEDAARHGYILRKRITWDQKTLKMTHQSRRHSREVHEHNELSRETRLFDQLLVRTGASAPQSRQRGQFTSKSSSYYQNRSPNAERHQLHALDQAYIDAYQFEDQQQDEDQYFQQPPDQHDSGSDDKTRTRASLIPTRGTNVQSLPQVWMTRTMPDSNLNCRLWSTTIAMQTRSKVVITQSVQSMFHVPPWMRGLEAASV
jgi:hypothetical protein